MSFDKCIQLCKTFAIKIWKRDFPGDPVVKTSPPNAGSAGSIPDQRAKIPHVLWPKKQNIKQKQYCKKFNKDLRKGSTSTKT